MKQLFQDKITGIVASLAILFTLSFVVLQFIPTPPIEQVDIRSAIKERDIPFTKEGTAIVLSQHDTIAQFDAELASSRRELSLGLMYRTTLGKQQSMFLQFDTIATRSLWMRNTYFSLDMLMIDSTNTITDIYTYTKPFSDDYLSSSTPISYALEINAGLVDQFGIETGHQVFFTPLVAADSTGL